MTRASRGISDIQRQATGDNMARKLKQFKSKSTKISVRKPDTMSVGAMNSMPMGMSKGGKCFAKGGSIDGVARSGKTRGKIC